MLEMRWLVLTSGGEFVHLNHEHPLLIEGEGTAGIVVLGCDENAYGTHNFLVVSVVYADGVSEIIMVQVL